MKFDADWKAYVSRYCSGLVAFLSILLFIIIRPLSIGKGFMFFEMFDKIFFTDIRLVGLFLGLILFCQIIGYLQTQRNINYLEIKKDMIIFILFNKKTFEFKYSELTSIALVKDLYLGLIFEIILKNEKIQKIDASSIKDKEMVVKSIQQKIKESK